MEKNVKQPITQVVYNGDIPNTPLRFLWYLGNKYKFLGLVSFSLVFFAETLNIMIYYVSARLVDNFTATESLIEQKEVLYFWGGLFLLVSIGNSLLYRLSGFTAIAWVIKFHKDGYEELYQYLTGHSHNYFSNRFAGALSNKVSNAVDSSAGLTFQILWTFFSEFIGIVITLILFFTVDIRIGFVLLTTLMLVVVFNIFAARKRRPLVVSYSQASSKSRGEGVDAITNITAVHQYAKRSHELGRLSGVFADRAFKDVKQAFLGEWIMVANTIFAIIMTAIVLVILYLLLSQGEITAGVLVLVLGLLGRVGYMFITIGQALNRFIREYGNIEEGLNEILLPHEIIDEENAVELAPNGGEIIWKDVTFEFGNNTVFDKFNLNIKPGQRIGLVGHSGAGKTTFVSLMLR
ncbi:ABC transporter ATP-binding protein, partial [Candidatus Kaiserbacteria bacterium]|nr:ABC transporter ATP-binding protein [Candidatus Kaiserbacteria bacterium]